MALSEGWKSTMIRAVKDPRSAAYDGIIRYELGQYQARFAQTPDWSPLSFRLFKAKLPVESGGPEVSAWTGAVAQIGANPQDAGYGVLKSGEEWAYMILSPQMKTAIATKPIKEPDLNVRAAIAYTLTKAFRVRSVSEVSSTDSAFKQYTVVKGDSFEKIARLQGTTVVELTTSNPGVKGLSIGQVVRFRRASMQPKIQGWHQITPAFLTLRYNAGGDKNYLAKINFVLGLLP